MILNNAREFRCIDCNKLLFKWRTGSFEIVIVCPRCGCDNDISWLKQVTAECGVESQRAPEETGFFDGREAEQRAS